MENYFGPGKYWKFVRDEM